MKKTTAFWDASALVPLCVQELATPAAASRLREFVPVIWWGTAVEVQGAICRLHREQAINNAGKKLATLRLDALRTGWREISPSDELREFAFDVLDDYALRAADSLQVAAALIWCDERPARRNFICADYRLSNAAKSVGFSVIELPRTPLRR